MQYAFEVGRSPANVRWVSYEPKKTLVMIQSFYESFGTMRMTISARNVLRLSGFRV
jgi:hypothetical protein